ncbi:ribosomal protein L35 [Tremella mesenterica]|uniref:50S ribosomal protein L35 n=1 Tax=Tremella mesenterica TaxID=5217 RepID=A0A4Q1BWV0_TREME|nr:ribosomal protein L35 [Tremella mesenterica]
MLPVTLATLGHFTRTALRLHAPFRIVGTIGAWGTSRGLSSSIPCQKLKSHSGSKKRFSVTATGLFKRHRAGKQHLNTGKSAGKINRLGLTTYATPSQAKRLRRLLPYA